jgi:phosphatidate phosphatase PAH1
MCACVDVIAVRQANDTIKCSPMIVRFYKEATVTQHVGVMIDGEPIQFKCNFRLVLDQGKRYAHFQPYVEEQPRNPVRIYSFFLTCRYL